MRRLPSYRNPPVVEVAIGVQFDPVEWLIAPRLGLVWERFKEEFPNLEQHPPLPSEVEKLGERRSPGIQLNFRIRGGDVTPRIWMLNDEGSELVQVQPDRFHRNWRKYQDRERTYPRYAEHVRPSFLGSLQKFQQYLIDSGGPDLKIRQCELIYVNHIRSDGTWSGHQDLGRVFRCWDGSCIDAWGDKLENVSFTLRKILSDSAGKFLGRLHVQVEPVFLNPDPPVRPEEEPVFMLTLTARGRPIGETEASVVQFLDLAHEQIVTTFDEVTTPQMHSLWGKE